MSNHTKGEWKYSGGNVYLFNSEQENVHLKYGRVIASLPFHVCPPEEHHANGDLIAAAPELLDACETVLEAIEELRSYSGVDFDVDVTEKLEKAIAKAKSEAE